MSAVGALVGLAFGAAVALIAAAGFWVGTSPSN